MYLIVWNIRSLACALACFLAEEIDCTDGGASGGKGVERPLVDGRVSACHGYGPTQLST